MRIGNVNGAAASRATLRQLPAFVRALDPVVKEGAVRVNLPAGNWSGPEGSVIKVLEMPKRCSAAMINDRLWPRVTKKQLKAAFGFESAVSDALRSRFIEFADIYDAETDSKGFSLILEGELSGKAVNLLAEQTEYPLSVQSLFSGIGNQFFFAENSGFNSAEQARNAAAARCMEMLYREINSNIEQKMPQILTEILDSLVHGYRYFIR